MSTRVQDTPQAVYSRHSGKWVKRALDVLFAAGLLLLLAPLIAAIAAVLRLTDRGPLFFAWNILGMGGRPIRSYKFRTMVQAAETIEADLRRQGQNEMKSVYFKSRNDPRVTPVGRILRRFSLDEIPSLWSVVKGEMSVVGPRPVRVTEAKCLKDWHYQRFAVQPGLTSPWVVGHKTEVTDFDEIAAIDLEYIRNWSLWADVKILAATVRYVLSGRNY